MTVTLAKTWYTNFGDGSTTGYYAVPLWTLNTPYTVGNIVRQKTAPAVGSERCFVCIVAGTSSNTTEPTWVLTKGTKTPSAGNDGTVLWMECTGMPSMNADSTNTPLSSQNRAGVQALGQIIQNNAGTYFFICTTTGVTGAGEPTYNLTAGVTTNDNICVWTCLGAISTFTTKWGSPQARISSNLNPNYMVSGDTAYISSIHAETAAAAASLTAGTVGAISKFICVANGGSIPPGSADVTTGAQWTTTGTSSAFTFSGTAVYMEGITFNCGTSTALSNFNIASGTALMQVFKNCALTFGGSQGQGLFVGASGRSLVILDNFTITFNGVAGSAMNFSGGHIVWKNTPSALAHTGAAWPTTLFLGTAVSGDYLIENVDLSSFAGTNIVTNMLSGGCFVFKDCLLPNITLSAQTQTGPAAERMDFINCDSGGNIYNHARYWYEGQHVVSTSAVRTGGASDGTTAFSWKITTGSNCQWFDPFTCLPIQIWNTVINPTNRTVTIEGAYVGTSLPNTDDIWIDVNYYGTSSSTLGTCNTTTKANILASGSPWGSSTALWGGSASARANTHAYALGDLIGVLSAPSGTIVRLFQCTTAGTSSGSLPAGYASAVDGGQVNDGGTCVFTAVERFQLTTTLSAPQAQSVGYFTIYVYVAKQSSIYYVDPYVTLS